MQSKPGIRTYSLGERKLPAPRRSSGKRKRSARNAFRLLSTLAENVVQQRRVLGLGLALLVLLAGVVAAYNLPLLEITKVEIAGAQTLDPAKTRASLRLEGGNMLSVDAQLIEKTLRQQPAVKSVSVRKFWPNKVVVQITERRTAAFWQTPDGTYAVDDEGVVIAESPAPGPLPAIVSGEGGLRVGSRVPQATLVLAKALADKLPRAVGAKPKQFEYSATNGLAVLSDQGWWAIFGDDRDTDFKLSTLSAVLKTARERKINFLEVDLRFGERPFLRQG